MNRIWEWLPEPKFLLLLILGTMFFTTVLIIVKAIVGDCL